MNDGWDDDDDGINLVDSDLEDEIDIQPPVSTTLQSDSIGAKKEDGEFADGWDDDNIDVFDNDNDDDLSTENVDKNYEKITAAQDLDPAMKRVEMGLLPAATPVTVSTNAKPPTKNIGWEDDDDGLNFDDDGWGDDDRVIEAEATDNVLIPSTEAATLPSYDNVQRQTAKSQRIFQELDQYVRSLGRMLSSINAILESEYNTPEKALELVEYYSSRPQLAKYTVSKELPRMNYQIVLPEGHIETDKEQIVANNLLTEKSLVSRASNQSLLADLLHVITGHDLIVRPQYLAICVASWCQFVIHLGDQGQDLVQCQAKLHLSFPTEHGDRLDVAVVHVAVVFVPSQPMIEYKVQNIEVLLQDPSQLNGTVQFLCAMEGHMEELPEHVANERMKNAPADIFRDQFLENSQRLFAQSTKGMKSALSQVDSVINVRGKLQAISKLIPAADTLLAAEQEAMALAEARQRQLEMQMPPPVPNSSQLFPRTQPTDRQQQMAQTSVENRPKSILGSLLGAVASSVTIPNDDVVDTYAPLNSKPAVSRQREEPRLYREDETSSMATNIPRLYNKGEPPHTKTNEEYETLSSKKGQDTSAAAALPTLYRRDTTEATDQVHKVPNSALTSSEELKDTIQHQRYEETLQHAESIEEVFADGWDDQDEGDLDNVIEAEHFVEKSVPVVSQEITGTDNQDILGDGWNDVDASEVPQLENDENAGIIPTRKRWVNPRPNRPYLYGQGY